MRPATKSKLASEQVRFGYLPLCQSMHTPQPYATPVCDYSPFRLRSGVGAGSSSSNRAFNILFSSINCTIVR